MNEKITIKYECSKRFEHFKELVNSIDLEEKEFTLEEFRNKKDLLEQFSCYLSTMANDLYLGGNVHLLIKKNGEDYIKIEENTRR